ncbi:MAG: serine hydrolase, partial [Lapillicoccus sp.]
MTDPRAGALAAATPAAATPAAATPTAATPAAVTRPVVNTAAVTDPPELPGYDGLRWSASIVDHRGAVVWEHDAALVLPTASVGKLLLLITTAELIEAGQVDPGTLLSRTGDPGDPGDPDDPDDPDDPNDLVRDSGLWHMLQVDRLSVEDLATLIGAVSDNLATNV